MLNVGNGQTTNPDTKPMLGMLVEKAVNLSVLLIFAPLFTTQYDAFLCYFEEDLLLAMYIIKST